ncbi:MAG: class I SAM-dependent methyltransferase [Alphaproteobacteria bacterium]|jgi:23S rRNA (cytosine1962-C5)-methyltransferase|nr:class I SAM-dependent methyltransferase [Alphaproteobacteria bacterium]
MPATPTALYTLLDSGYGRKLEQIGGVVVNRPEPQALWAPVLPEATWAKAQATFAPKTEDGDGGNWQKAASLPEKWPVTWGNLQFYGRLTPFRHLGVFPEQAPQWDWLKATVTPGMQVLNLFGYTGVASLVAAHAGAKVVHVDASKKALTFGRENAELAGLAQAPIRWIPDDALGFLQREARRGNQYDVVLLDPPKFGRADDGTVWEFLRDMPTLLEALSKVVKPTGHVWLTAYTLRLSGVALASMLRAALPPGSTASGEFTVTDQAGRSFGVSMWGRWEGKAP